MNRTLFSSLLICVFVVVQALSLHAHLPHVNDAHAGGEHAEAADHRALHIHSHAVTGDSDDEHEYADATPIDLLLVAKRDNGMHTDIAIATLWIVLLAALWIGSERPPRPQVVRLFHPPQFRPLSPRAPPR